MEKRDKFDLKEQEEAELREYEKRSLVIRAAAALGTMVISGLAGYFAGKLGKKQ